VAASGRLQIAPPIKSTTEGVGDTRVHLREARPARPAYKVGLMLSGWQQALACGRIGQEADDFAKNGAIHDHACLRRRLASLKAYELPVLADALGMDRSDHQPFSMTGR